MFLPFCSSSSGPRLNPGVILCAVLLAFLLGGCATVTSQQSSTSATALSLSATSFDFKTVVVGQTGKQNLTILNTGSSSVHLTGLSISNKEFTIGGPSVPQTIAPQGSLSYTISFTPTAVGSATATLSVASDATTASSSVALSGSGQKAFANLLFTPTAVNFGNLALQATATQNVTMQNTGDISMTVQGITVAGAGFGYASLSPGLSLAPNQTVTFQVWFTPKVAGAAAATVSFLSPSLSSPETLALAGDGVSGTGVGTPPPTSHSVHLTWNASSSQIIGYRVYRSETSGGSFAPLNGTALTALSYDDPTVSLGTTYYYVITAVDASGNESVYSNQATAVIPTA